MSRLTAEPIVVICVADQRYVRGLTVMLRSVSSNLAADRALEVHVVDGGIADDQKRAVERSLASTRHSVSWQTPERSRFVGLPLWGRMPIAAYDKLLIPALLPKDYAKVLYLDCDLLVLTDVAELWEADLDDRHALAVPDALVPHVSSRFGVAGYRELGLDGGARYFNSGVMLVNLPLWRRDDVTGRALDYLKRFRDRVCFWDQEGLNAVLAGKWGELDRRWNWNASIGWLTRAATDAHVVHFTGNLKPWTHRGQGPYHSLYYRTLDETQWAGWRPERSWRSVATEMYETSRLRRIVYPAEKWWMAWWKAKTRHYATESDVRVPTAAPLGEGR